MDELPLRWWHEGGVRGVFIDPADIEALVHWFDEPERAKNVLRNDIENSMEES